MIYYLTITLLFISIILYLLTKMVSEGSFMVIVICYSLFLNLL